ncbi:MAG: GAF domain-containing sensor histidine kinase [Chloroflexota bacterium]
MTELSNFLSANMFLVFFVYGLAFFVTGLVVALESPRSSGLRLAGSLKYLAVFGILTGLAGWIDMVQAVPGLTPTPTALPFHELQPINCFECHADSILPAAGGGNVVFQDAIKVFLMVVGGLSLGYFGVRLWEQDGTTRRLRLLPLALLSAWLLVAVGIRAMLPFSAEQWLANASILARYFILLPASVSAAMGLLRERDRLRELGLPQLASSCSWAAGFFVLLGVAGGVVVPPAPYPPANLVNYATFFALTGVPVQVVRALAAIAIAYFLVRVLRVFGVEHDRRLESAQAKELKAQQEALAAQQSARQSIEAWNRELEERVSQRTRELETRNRELAALNSIAGTISQSPTVAELLPATLEKVLGLVRSAAGAVYLLDKEGKFLALEIISGSGAWLNDLGPRVKLGQGPVGVAAEAGQAVSVAQSASASEARGSIRCLPLLSKGKVQGVLALVAAPGQELSAQEEDILRAVAGEVGVAIENARLVDELQNMAVLEERDRIAREMHDGLAQVLGYLNLRLHAAAGMLSGGDVTSLRAELDSAAAVTQEAYADVREAILGLRTAPTPQHDLAATLNEYLRKYHQHSRIPTELTVDLDGDQTLSPAAEVQVIRIIQEALTNVRKHARAHHAWVRLQSEAQCIRISIVDDGRGFQVGEAQRDGHFGLQTMRERAESVGGQVTIESAPGAGTTVLVTIPVTTEGGRANGANSHAVGGRPRSLS